MCDDKKCSIKGCGKTLRRTDAKYCSRCSYFFYNFSHQKRFAGATVEVLEKAVADRIKTKGNRNGGGQKPKYLKVRKTEPEVPEVSVEPQLPVIEIRQPHPPHTPHPHIQTTLVIA